MKMLQKIIFFYLVLTLVACGHSGKASGGPKDLEALKIISSNPETLEEITKELTLTFSKPVDRNTVLHNITIYPSVDFKTKIKDNTIKIIVQDSIPKNETFYLNVSKNVKGYHQNELDKNYTFLFHSGKLATIKSYVQFDLPENAMKKNAMLKYTLMKADSTFMFSKSTQDFTAELPYLYSEEYIIRAYYDQNFNKKYDKENEPFLFTDYKPQSNRLQNFLLAYEDTTMAKVKRVVMKDQTKVNILFSEPIITYDNLQIVSNDSLALPVNIIAKSHSEDEINLLVAVQDSIGLKLSISNLTDLYENTNKHMEYIFNNTTIPDTLSPFVVSSNPRDGGVLSDLQPKITLKMNEIILDRDIQYRLKSVEDDKNIEMNLLSQNSDEIIFSPKNPLQNYASYKLTLSSKTKDFSDNELKQNFSIVFLVVKQ